LSCIGDEVASLISPTIADESDSVAAAPRPPSRRIQQAREGRAQAARGGAGRRV